MNTYQVVIHYMLKNNIKEQELADIIRKATVTMYAPDEAAAKVLVVKDTATYFPQLAGKTLLYPVITSVVKLQDPKIGEIVGSNASN